MGYRIREMRTAIGMTQEELAKKSGVSRVLIALLESGAQENTTTKTLVALANAMGTTVGEIFYAESD